ncbi:hypothetical protein [Clostridium pasteurianum]|uniref:Uncharacterized protein n=1 Tax=Clostridium pasteurianum BC1 TaxID=86416 RepID=R4KHF3_CLOPA|nr:hypothetical protein [Clostridium pasteurianum]AGK99030.1 hypothetical protein Clopa_4311 [Clostridium pasteurianum BC1]
MANKFLPGLKYVFTKKNYIKRFGKKEYRDSKRWVNRANGGKVKVASIFSGDVRGFLVSPEWCKCIGKE